MTPRSPQAARTLALWAAVMALGWGALGLVLCAQSLWDVPSQLVRVAPGLYQIATAWLPTAWLNAPRNGGWVWGPLSATLLYLALMSGLWTVYLIAARAAANPALNRSRPRRLIAGIILVGLVVGGLAVLWPGLFSSDIFYYAALSKMQVVYGLNPLVQSPSAMQNDPWLATTPFIDQRSPYGPIWLGTTWLIGMAAQAAGGDHAIYIMGFRLLNLGLLAVATGLIWAIGGQLGWPMVRRTMAAVLFAWCPLIITELAGNGHNDALLIVCLLLAIWLHLRGAWPLAIVALVLGGLVKLPGFFLLPAYGLLLLRTSSSRMEAVRRTGIGLGLAALVALVAYAPYGHPDLGSALTSNPDAGFFAASLVNSVRWLIIDAALALRGTWMPADITAHAVSLAVRWPLWYGAVALWVPLAVYFTWQARDFTSLLRAWALTLFSYLLIGSGWFQPWYITWLVPFIALLPASPLRRAVLLLALGGSLCYVVSPYIPGDTTQDLRHYYVPVVIFLPTLLYCAHEGLRALTNRRGHGLPAPV
jgi:hypothetical protein